MKRESGRENGRLIIVDPSLKDTRGHHFSLTRVIVDSAVNSGFKVIVFSSLHTAANLQIDGARIRPVFSKSTYDYFISAKNKAKVPLKQKVHQFVSPRCPESLKIILRRWRERLKKIRNRLGGQVGLQKPFVGSGLCDELQNALIEEQVGHSAHILVHTADGMMYRAILQLLQIKYPLGEYPNFHLCTPYDMRLMPHKANGLSIDRVIGYLDKMGFIGRNVFLYAENELLADSLKSVWDVDVSTLDIPMKVISQEKAVTAINKDEVFRVIYLGAAREEKGFHLIPDIIEVVLNSENKAPRVEFIIQCSPQIVGYTKKIESVIERLKSFSSTNVKLIKQQQSEEDYYSVLESADVVLCCYQKENYRVRGSGIATEAVAFGKSLITTPETYPEWLAGDAGISASGSKMIGAAILSIIKNRETYKAKAKRRAQWFFNRTRPDEYVKKLLVKEREAEINKEPLNKEEMSPILHGLDNGAGQSGYSSVARFQDVTDSENKYNNGLRDAGMSCDGKVLFIKQSSESVDYR